MKALLFGSSGTVGTAIERLCARKGIDCVSPSHREVDITDFAAVKTVIEKNKPDVVMNLVALVGIDQCEHEPERAFAVNVTAVSNIARICEQHGMTLVQPSTHAVFDGTKNGPYTEDDLPNPASVYSTSKYVAEFFAKNICTKHYIPRFPTLFGARRNQSQGFVEKMIDRILAGQELRVADDKIDTPTYTKDVAETIISLLEREKPYGIYHVANSGVVSYYDFIARLIEILKADVKLTRAKDKDFPALAYKPLNTALKSIKLEPLRSWQDALSDYITEELK